MITEAVKSLTMEWESWRVYCFGEGVLGGLGEVVSYVGSCWIRVGVVLMLNIIGSLCGTVVRAAIGFCVDL